MAEGCWDKFHAWNASGVRATPAYKNGDLVKYRRTGATGEAWEFEGEVIACDFDGVEVHVHTVVAFLCGAYMCSAQCSDFSCAMLSHVLDNNGILREL